ncbi:MAG: ATP-dependent metallopeptidase FtsH/Yme1/Tma family protein [Actinomycetota bacterium]
MSTLIDILLKPAFWISAIFIIGGTLLAVRMSARRSGMASGGQKVSAFSAEKVKVAPTQMPPVTFADVAGVDEALSELREIKEFLTDPQRFHSVGAELPKGILLYGPPGTGKTLLARALAGEAGVPFYSVSAANFVEMFVGVGAARVRALFEDAKKNAPSIVFIDELDAVGRRRNSDVPGEREFDHTLNQLLVELDGFATASGVLMIGATNRPELIDPALMRPGRFDRRIHVERPDRRGREAILRLHASKRAVSSHVDWANTAHQTAGLSGAELANIINEASFLAARRHHPKISQEDVQEAVDRTLTGQRRSRALSEDEKRLIAYHEAGHALLSLRLRGVKPVTRVSIVGRVAALGKSTWGGDDDKEVMTRRELMAQLMVLLGGRAAEKNTFGEPSTRSEDDLDHASGLARRMVERWAMTGKYELTRGASEVGPARSSKSTDQEVGNLLAQAERAALMILKDDARRLAAIAEALVDRETLMVEEIVRIAGLPSSAVKEEPLAAVRPLRASNEGSFQAARSFVAPPEGPYRQTPGSPPPPQSAPARSISALPPGLY